MKRKAFAKAILFLFFACVCVKNGTAFPFKAEVVAKVTDRSCTSFCLDYADGQSCLFGANLDYPVSRGLIFMNSKNMIKAGWDTGTTGERAVWTAKYGSLTFNWCGYQMPFAGMNEAGLVISTMYLPETRQLFSDRRPPLNSTFWLQYQLDNYSTVDEVIASDTKIRTTDGTDHYLLCDKLGNRAVIEFRDGKMTFYKGSTLPVKALTNSPYQESLQAWRSSKPHDESLVRFGTAANLLKRYIPNPNTALNSDNKAMVFYAFYILSATAQPITCWSMVFDNRNLQVYFFSKLNLQMCQIDFARLDFSGDNPVRMLNISEPLAGNISDQLPAYSHQTCLHHMLFAIRYLSPNMSEKDVASLLGFFEQFPYVQGGVDPSEQEISFSRTLNGSKCLIK